MEEIDTPVHRKIIDDSMQEEDANNFAEYCEASSLLVINQPGSNDTDRKIKPSDFVPISVLGKGSFG